MTTKELPAASTTADLSPVPTPDGSGFGPSSARHAVDRHTNSPTARRTRTLFRMTLLRVNERGDDRLSSRFVISWWLPFSLLADRPSERPRTRSRARPASSIGGQKVNACRNRVQYIFLIGTNRKNRTALGPKSVRRLLSGRGSAGEACTSKGNGAGPKAGLAPGLNRLSRIEQSLGANVAADSFTCADVLQFWELPLQDAAQVAHGLQFRRAARSVPGVPPQAWGQPAGEAAGPEP